MDTYNRMCGLYPIGQRVRREYHNPTTVQAHLIENYDDT